MRRWRIIGWVAGATVALLAFAFVGLQTAPGKALLASLVSSKQLKVSGLTGFFPTDLGVAHIELADDQGTWLTIEYARLGWSFASLFNGRLRVDVLSAERIDVARPPQPDKKKPDEGGGSLSLPVGVDLKSLSVPDLHLGAALAGGVDSHWTLQGSGLLAADRGESRLVLDATRSDGPSGHLKVNLQFLLDRFFIDGDIAGDEAGNGVAAAVLGRPDLDRVSFKLTAKGERDAGTMKLDLAAGDALTSKGSVDWHRDGTSTGLSVHLAAQAPGLPDSPIARLLRAPVTADAEASLSDAGVWSLRTAAVVLGPARLEASGTYDIQKDALEGSATLTADEAGALADLGSVTWRNLRLEVKAQASGLQGAAQSSVKGSATLSGSADDVAPTNLGERAPPPGHVDLSGKVALQNGRLVVDALDVTSPLANVKVSGSYGMNDREGDGKVTVDFGDLGGFSSLAAMPLAGNGRLEFDLHLRAPGSRVAWQGTLNELSLPGVPADVAHPSIALKGAANLRPDGSWQIDGAQISNDALSLDVTGQGRPQDSGTQGEVNLTLSLPRMAAVAPDVAGSAKARAKLTLKKGGGDLHATLDLDGLSRGGIDSHHLALAADATLEGKAARGSLKVDGDLANQPLALSGSFSQQADGSLSVPSAEGHWASASLDVKDLTVTPKGATGSGHLKMAKLQDLSPLVGEEVAGSLDVDLATEPDAAGKLRLALRGEGLRGGGAGVGRLQLDATVSDPLGAAATDAMLKTERLSGVADIGSAQATLKGDRHAFDLALKAAGGSTAANLTAKVEPDASQTVVTLQRFDGRQQGIDIALAAPTRLTIAGGRIAIAPTSLRLGGCSVALNGTVDPTASDLKVEIKALPLSLVEKVAPGTGLDGSLQASARVTGALAVPRVQATYAVTGVRLKRPETALLPALGLHGTATLVDRQTTFDAIVGTAGNTKLALKGKATLPQGSAPLNATVALSGTMDLAPFAPALGDGVRNLGGTLRPDLTLTLAGKAMTGSGTLSLSGAALTLPASGMRLSNGQANIALQGGTLQLQKLSFQTARNGELSGTGTVRLDPAQGFPVDLSIASQRALVANRPDLMASVSSDIKVSGNTNDGFEVRGPITIDRAEIAIGLSSAGNYPVLPVREINGKKPVDAALAPPPKPAASPSGTPIRLALDIKAPQAVFVRGRGLNAEVGGQFKVTGDPGKPAVQGSLTLRRGTFDMVGHRLDFTRGNVALMSATTIDPQLDFAATTNVQSTTIEVDITGTAREPKFALTSSPALPQDEAMAILLFGKPSAALSPVEILTAAQAVSELTSGSPVGSGFLGRLRKSTGLDQLSVEQSSASPGSSSSPSPSLQGGRYVAPGIYVGAEQGTSGTSSRGVVEVEVLKHTKIVGAVGTDSNDRIGAKMEWDY
jgi:translocation and assembly module TamB